MNRSDRRAMKDRTYPGHGDIERENQEIGVRSVKGLKEQHGGTDSVELHDGNKLLRFSVPRNGEKARIGLEAPFQGCQGTSHCSSQRQRKLVIHFDIRNTVLVADSVTKVNVEQALNSFLTSVTWGSVDEYSGKWSWHSRIPSLTPPAPHTVTYYKHLERKLVKTPEDRQKLRFTTGDFTQTGIGKIFLPYFEKHMRLLRWTFTQDRETLRRMTMKGKDHTLYHYILPSFFKLLFHLHKNEREFAIVFRTYGLDATNVLLSTEYTINGNHPQFPEPLKMVVNRSPGTIQRNSKGGITLTTEPNGKDCSSSTTHNRERDIYEMLSKLEGVSAFKDDFLHWQNHGYHYSSGKPLWIDLNDESVHHIMFDDNIRTYEDDNIVDLRILDGDKARSLSKPEVAKYEDVFTVQSDLMASIEHEDYFINKVRLCEDNYSKLLTNYM